MRKLSEKLKKRFLVFFFPFIPFKGLVKNFFCVLRI